MASSSGYRRVLVLAGTAVAVAAMSLVWFFGGDHNSRISPAVTAVSDNRGEDTNTAESVPDSNENSPLAQAPGDPNEGKASGSPFPAGLGEEMEDATSNKLHVEILRNMYSEASHEITELPLPSDPVLLQLRHKASDKGSSYKTRVISVEDWPMGMTIGRVCARTTSVKDVDEAKNTAEMTDSLKTVATFGVDIVTDSLNVGNLDISQEYTLSGSGARQEHNTEWKSENLSNVKMTGDVLQVYAFPPTALQPNRKHTMNLESAVKNLPAQWNEPPKLDVALTGHVLFDGQPAYRLEADHTGYGAVQIPLTFLNLKEPMKTKIRTHGKYYVSVDTGRVLWSEMKMEVVDCTFPAANGMAITAREELASE